MLFKFKTGVRSIDSYPDLVAIPSDVELRSPARAARIRWWVSGVTTALILATVPAAIVAAIAVANDVGAWIISIPVTATIAALLVVRWWVTRRWARYGYGVSDDALRVRDGVVVHSDVVAPLHRVQHVDVSRGPIQLLVGVATLVVHTAAPAADVRIADIPTDDAAALRDHILAAARRAAEDVGTAAVDGV